MKNVWLFDAIILPLWLKSIQDLEIIMANDRYENFPHPYFIELIKYGGLWLKKAAAN